MKQLLHDFRSGMVVVTDVPRPAVEPNCILVRNHFSVVSPGTERAVIESRSRNLVRTALERKDLVRRVLAKAKRDGILATLQAVKRKLDASLPLGYACAGTVIGVAPEVMDLREGETVACAGAGFACHAEYVCVPRMLCAKVPEGIPLEAAAFATLGAVAMHGVRQAAAQFGETVAVLGLGVIGQLTAQLLAAAGARVVAMDIVPERVAMAVRICSCDGVTVGPAADREVAALTGGLGVDRVIVAAASKRHDVLELAGVLCRDRGTVVVVGQVPMHVPRHLFYEKELDLRLSRSYGPGRYDPSYELGGLDYPIAYVRWTEARNLQEFLRLVQRGTVRPLELVTHRYPIERAVEAYVADPGETCVKLGLLIEYPSEGTPPAEERIVLRVPRSRKTGLGIGIIGAGSFVRGVLLPAMARIPAVRVIALASARGVSARDLAQKYKCEFCTSDVHALVNYPAVDAVFICTPHCLHAEHARIALAAGKAVYLEKPLCTREEDIEEIIEAVKRAKVPFQVGFNRRFAPMGEQFRNWFAPRKTPMMLHYRVNAGKAPPGHWTSDPEVGGGRIVGEACHFIDFAKFLIGGKAELAGVQKTGETPDDVVALLRFGDGSQAAISYVTSGPPAYPKECVEGIAGGKACVLEDFRQIAFHDGRRLRQNSATQDKGHRFAFERFVRWAAGETEGGMDVDDVADTTRMTFRMSRGSY
jgi:predicted dehydrogenase/threonine dehydrogenase-like Zn-dependent dehydrogenase